MVLPQAQGDGGMIAGPEQWDEYDPDADAFDDDDILDDCAMMPDGQCLLAGSEWCDWECPRGGLR